MKRVLVLLAAAAITMSCEKEQACNCGTVTDDGIDNGCYWLTVRNSCSGNKTTLCFDRDVWFDANVGEDFCITNLPSW